MKDDNGDKAEHLVLQAACRVVHRYEAGIEVLAKAIGRTPKYLLNAVTGAKGAKLNVEDAEAIARITGDNEMLEVMAKCFGFKLHPLQKPSVVSSDPRAHLTEAIRGFGIILSVQSQLLGDESGTKLAKLMEAFGQYCRIAADVNTLPEVSLNQMRKVDVAFSAVWNETHTFGALFPQFFADILASNKALQAFTR